MKLLSPIDAEGHVTTTYWDSLDDYATWREGSSFERAHDDSSAEEVFDGPNQVEVHEVIVERIPGDSAEPVSEDV